MTRFGIDYAWGTPSISGLKQAGVKFVCNYLSPDASKNVNRSEAESLTKAGIDIVVVWESTAGRAAQGFAAGAADARAARSQAAAAGMPSSRPIHFAVDFDAAPSQIYSYFDGVKSVLGYDRTGVYGSYNVVKALHETKRAKFLWQTYAWSGGRWYPSAQLQQYSNDHSVAGVSCDYDRAVADDFGQWRIGQVPESRDERKLRKWEEELDRIRAYIRKHGGHWHNHPIRWARARRLKRVIAKYRKKLHK